jgi:hypothetical protein
MLGGIAYFSWIWWLALFLALAQAGLNVAVNRPDE